MGLLHSLEPAEATVRFLLCSIVGDSAVPFSGADKCLGHGWMIRFGGSGSTEEQHWFLCREKSISGLCLCGGAYYVYISSHHGELLQLELEDSVGRWPQES